MTQSINCVTLVVRDYDEAITYFTGVLQFALVEDTVLSDSKRWVLVAPYGPSGTSVLLAKAATPTQRRMIGDQTGGRVAFFLQTDDFLRDYEAMKARGVRFLEEPRNEAYGTVAVFEDLYGNRWDLVEARKPSSGSRTARKG